MAESDEALLLDLAAEAEYWHSTQARHTNRLTFSIFWVRAAPRSTPCLLGYGVEPLTGLSV